MTDAPSDIISKQATRDSVVSYAATIFAVVASLWIYPAELAAYGLAQILVSTAVLIVPFATFGTLAMIVKFFPEYEAANRSKSFLFNVLLLSGGLIAISLVIGLVVNRSILLLLDSLKFDVNLILQYKYVILGFTMILWWNQTLTLHASNYKRIAIPAIYNYLFPKIALPILVLLYNARIIDLFMFVHLWVASFAIPTISLVIYLIQIGAFDLKPRITFLKKERFRAIMNYSFFVGLSNMGAILIGRIDIIMVGMLIGTKEAGVYGISLFVANVLHIPTGSIWKIASPVVSKAFDVGDMRRVASVYKKSSRNLIILGVFMYLVINGTLDSVIHFSSGYAKLQPIVPLFAILGLSKLVDMATSVNHQIIAYSEKYKYLLFFIIILALANIGLTYFLIMKIGITGAAWATVISVTLYNLTKSLLVYRWFRVHPLSNDSYKILALIVLACAYAWLIPTLSSHILNIIVFSTGLVLVYAALIKVLNIQAEVVTTATSRLRLIFSGK